MNKVKSFKVGDITITQRGNRIWLNQIWADNPERVVMAILAVARHLGWANGPFRGEVLMAMGQKRTIPQGESWTSKDLGYSVQFYYSYWLGDIPVEKAIWKGDRKPFILPTTQSHSGRTVYVGHKPVMTICRTGNTDWVSITRTQIRAAWNDWWYNDQKTLIPEYAWRMLSLLTVEEVDN